MALKSFPAAHASVPNLAPMVDVVMVILIFFMLGTSFSLLEGVLPTRLPSQIGPGGGAAVEIIPTVQIALQESADPASCRIVVLDQELASGSFADLQAFMNRKRLDGADPTGPVLIGAEPGVRYQNVISAMDACVQAGFGNIQFSVGSGAAAVDSGD